MLFQPEFPTIVSGSHQANCVAANFISKLVYYDIGIMALHAWMTNTKSSEIVHYLPLKNFSINLALLNLYTLYMSVLLHVCMLVCVSMCTYACTCKCVEMSNQCLKHEPAMLGTLASPDVWLVTDDPQ